MNRRDWKFLVPLDSRDLSRLAILLDVDRTLLDIAPTPQQVQVPGSLPQTLARARERVGGALALVSGRPIAELDAFFARLTQFGVRPLTNYQWCESILERGSTPQSPRIGDGVDTGPERLPREGDRHGHRNESTPLSVRYQRS